MRCPVCKALKQRVIETRKSKRGIKRRRVCMNGHRFTTIERILKASVTSMMQRRREQLRIEAIEALREFL